MAMTADQFRQLMAAQTRAVKMLLDAYEALLLPASASNMARSEAKNASQDEGETILHWHGRLRNLYQRANPQLTLAQLNEDRNLIAAFIDGLTDSETIRFTLQANPLDYTAALNSANNSFTAAAGHRRALAIKTEPADNSIAAVSYPSTKRPCSNCKSPSHWRNDCPKGNKDRRQPDPRDSKNSSSRPYRGHFTSRGRNKGSRRNNSGGKHTTKPSGDYLAGFMACLQGKDPPKEKDSAEPAEN